MDHPARFAYRRPDLGEEAGRGTDCYCAVVPSFPAINPDSVGFVRRFRALQPASRSTH